MNKYYLYIFFAALFLLSSCNDTPTEVGYSFVGDTVEVFTLNTRDTAYLTKIEPKIERRTLLNEGTLLIGRTGGYTAATLLRFMNIPYSETVPYSSYKINPSTIVECNLIIYAQKHTFGPDSLGAISFDIYKMYDDKPWAADLYNAYKWGEVFDETGNTNFKEYKIGAYTGIIPLDSSTKIVVPLTNNNFIYTWIQTESNYQSNRRLFDSIIKVVKDTNLVWPIYNSKKIQTDTVTWGIGLLPNTNNNHIRHFSTNSIANKKLSL